MEKSKDPVALPRIKKILTDVCHLQKQGLYLKDN
jgi:hypothetical protein